MPRIKAAKDHQQILWFLASRGIYTLYHFTPVTNLRSIFRKRAIYSRSILHDKDMLDRVECGGDERSHLQDYNLGNSDFVSLSFRPRMPMAFRREEVQHICYLVVDYSVAARAGVMFANKNAASTEAQRAEGLDGLQRVDFDAVKRKTAYAGTEAHSNRQAEVLVPDQVLVSDVLYVAFRSQASLDEARRHCHGLEHLPAFRVEPELFSLGEANVFGCVNAALRNRHRFRPGTTRQLKEDQFNNLLASPTIERRPVKRENGISLVQHIMAVPDLLLTVKWYGPGRTGPMIKGVGNSKISFTDYGLYAVCTTLGPQQLEPGRWRVVSELRLNNTCVRQFKMQFDVVARETKDTNGS